jgi:AcrR family transcriptional regulator
LIKKKAVGKWRLIIKAGGSTQMHQKKIVKNRGEGAFRQQIMVTALKLFAQKGYAATTIREIIDEVGVSAPSLYYYFGSKEGLYKELMETHCAKLESVVSQPVRASKSARRRLKGLVAGFFEHVVENSNFFRLMFSTYYGPSQGAPYFDFVLYHVKFHSSIKSILEEGIAAGEFAPGNTGNMTWVIRGVVQLAMEEQIKDDRQKIDTPGLQRILDGILDRLTVPIPAKSAKRGKVRDVVRAVRRQ